jgi:hypothetical protein
MLQRSIPRTAWLGPWLGAALINARSIADDKQTPAPNAETPRRVWEA